MASQPPALPRVAAMDESVVKALCSSIIGGRTVGTGAFQNFIFEDARFPRASLDALQYAEGESPEDWSTALTLLKEKDQQTVVSVPVGRPIELIVYYLKYLDRLQAAMTEIRDTRQPSFSKYMRLLLQGANTRLTESQTKSICETFNIEMRDAFIEAVRTAQSILDKTSEMVERVRSSVAPRLMQPDRDVVKTVLSMLRVMLTNYISAREAFHNVQFPLYPVLVVISARASGVPIQFEDFTKLGSAIPMTTQHGDFFGMQDQMPPPAVGAALTASSPVLSGNPSSVVIALRLWTLYRAIRQSKSVPLPMVLEGGAMRRKGKDVGEASKEEMTGGVAEDATSARMEVNKKFGTKITGLVEILSKAIDELASNPSTELITFFADSSNRSLILSFNDVAFPSNSYIPILSGYYRLPEVEARRKRYLGSLSSLIDALDKTISGSKLDGASKNSFAKCKETLKEMIGAIESSCKEMDAIFAKLATGQIASVTAGDTRITSEKEDVPLSEAGGYTGVESVHLTKALERLREAVHAAPTKSGILSGVDKIDEYLRNGRAICEAAVKTRLDDLKLTYQSILVNAPPASKELASKIISYKLKANEEFYKALLDTEDYLTKAHKALVNMPSVRDELYRAIAGWTLATQSTTLMARFDASVKELLTTLYPSTDDAIFSYAANDLTVRRMGASSVHAAAPDQDSPEAAIRDDKLIASFRRHLIAMLNFSPQLLLAFHLVSIIEKTFGREFDPKKMYETAVRYIVASAIDVCRREEALPHYAPAELMGKGVHFAGLYNRAAIVGAVLGGVFTNEAGGGAFAVGARNVATAIAANSGVANPPTEGTDGAHPERVGVYFRHVLGEIRLEDEMFVRWMKSICANLLLVLDRDRATHGVEKVNLPGAERLLIGGALDDPIGISGSRKVIPEAVPLYKGLPTACRAYEAYFTWEAEKVHWVDSEEPRLIIDVPRSSRFYTILGLVRGKKTKDTMSETFIAQMVAAVNELWGHFSSISDLGKRVTAIFDAFFDEINNTLLIRMASENAEVTAKKEAERDQDAIRGIPQHEDNLHIELGKGESRRTIRGRVLSALKGISMSVYDIMQRVNTSEDSIAADYKNYIERLTKRIGDVPEQDRFRELVRAMQVKDESVGDVEGLYMAFLEFVITPFFLLTSLIENVVYRAANLYIQILRCLYAARTLLHQGPKRLDLAAIPAVGAGAAPPVVDEDAVVSRLWFLYGTANEWCRVVPGGAAAGLPPGTPLRASSFHSHEEKLRHVLEHMEHENFSIQGFDVYEDLRFDNPFKTGIADPAIIANISTMESAVHLGQRKLYLHMYPTIYTCIQLLADAGSEFFKFSVSQEDRARVGSFEASRFIAFVDDSITSIRSTLGSFMKIGKREYAEKYFTDINGWDPKGMIAKVFEDVNRALHIVNCDYHLPREYRPTAVCYDLRFQVNGQHRTPAPVVPDPPSTCRGAIAAESPGFVDREWVVNYSRNLVTASETGSSLIHFEENCVPIQTGGRRWNWVTPTSMILQPAGPAGIPGMMVVPYQVIHCSTASWGSLGSRNGVLSPSVKSNGRIGPGAGVLPWSQPDSMAITTGRNSTPMETTIMCGGGLNTPALYSKLRYSRIPGIGGEGTGIRGLHMNQGSVTHGTMFHLDHRADGMLGPGRRRMPALLEASTGPTILSSLYGSAGYGTRAETLNRLMAKMATVLSIQGESQCILYELANAIVSHPDLSMYCQTIEVPVTSQSGKHSASYTFFPETIGTPVYFAGKWHVLYNNGALWSIILDGVGAHPTPEGVAEAMAELAAAGAGFGGFRDAVHSQGFRIEGSDLRARAGGAGEGEYTPDALKRYRDEWDTAPQPITNATNGVSVPSHKPGTFLYDVAVSPFYYSSTLKGVRRLAELSNTEMAKYLSSIPHFITTFKALLAEIEVDEAMNVESAWQHPDLYPFGAPLGLHNYDVLGDNSATLLPPPAGEDEGVMRRMKGVVQALITCLSDCYRSIREKYGLSVHMENVKGDFDPLRTAGKFDTTKLSTPLSILMGLGFVGPSGPTMMMGLGERGHKDSETSNALSWMAGVDHTELGNVDALSLESVPWTMALAERLQKLTNSSLDTVIQPTITRTARLGCLMNRLNLTAIACHNPWGVHSVSATIFHPHSLEITLASMNSGIDLLRGVKVTNYGQVDADPAHHYLVDGVLPLLGIVIHPEYIPSLYEAMYADLALGGGGHLIGEWVRVPQPLTLGLPEVNNARNVIEWCYTANMFAPEADGKVEYHRGPQGAEAALRQPGARELFRPRAAVAAAGALAIATANANNLYNYPADDMRTILPAAFPAHFTDAKAGVQLAALHIQLETCDTSRLSGIAGKRYVHNHIPSYNTIEDEERVKQHEAWVSNRTKLKSLVDVQMGFKEKDVAGTKYYDGAYMEMVRFSPPKDRWSVDSDVEERHMAGLFMMLKRNPVSILSACRLIPFASIYSFSEAFDLYFQIAASRVKKTRGVNRVRAHIPTLILNPLSISRHYKDFSSENRMGKTWIVSRTTAPFPGGRDRPYGERDTVAVNVQAAVGDGPANPTDSAWQFIWPPHSSIPSFYSARIPNPVHLAPGGVLPPGVEIGLSAPNNQAVVQNYSLAAFPLFAMYIRMLDQYGVILKDELSTRLKEVKYDNPESLAEYQNALINVLGAV